MREGEGWFHTDNIFTKPLESSLGLTVPTQVVHARVRELCYYNISSRGVTKTLISHVRVIFLRGGGGGGGGVCRGI